jgi:hypothetical protein
MRDWKDASEQCDRIADTIGELEDEGTVDKAPDFFESVKEKVTDIQETIDKRQQVTEKQQKALDNMEDAVNKWVH